MTDGRALLWVVLVLGAPWALVLVVALLRGYSIHVSIERPRRSERHDGARED